MTDSDQDSTAITNRSGGTDLNAGHDITISGDVVGRDKIVGYTVEQVSTLLTQINGAFQRKPFDGSCPYLGLDAFTEDDADRFFGRETLAAELIERVKESRFVVIAGPSGSGKSSLVRAGLIHALRQGVLPNSDRWLYATLTPSRDPIESLVLAISRLAKSPDAGDYVRSHASEPEALNKLLETLLSDRKDQRAVIFVDQFEEIFTQISRENERGAFLNLLTHTVIAENGRAIVLFALRSDFVLNCATYPQLNALLNQQFMQVGAMQPDELVSAIARPALRVGLKVDPDLVAQIVNDMQDEPGVLPLMQFALKDLFDAQQAQGGVIALTLNDYLARGGLHKALERHADAAFARLSETEQHLARTIFSGLIEVGRGTQVTRRTAVLGELVPAKMETAPVMAVVQKLADARLVTTDKRDNQELATISHERLIDAWPWLHRLVNENREAITSQNQIVEDAQAWKEHQQDASYLYSGARLATAREQLAEQRIVLGELALAFVETGIETERDEFEEAKQRAAQLRRRAIYLAGALMVTLIAGIAALFFAFQSNQQRQLAVARQLAVESQRLLERQPTELSRAVLLALESLRHSPTLEGDQSLDSGLALLPHEMTRLTHDKAVRIVAFSPDSRWVATGGGWNTAQIWEVKSGREVARLMHDNPVNAVVFSPDSRWVATSSGNSAWVWEVVSGREVMHLRHDDSVSAVAFSPDSRWVATGSGNSAWVWEAVSGREVARLAHDDVVHAVVFSPDGRWVATGSADHFARVWEIASGRELARLVHDDAVYGIVFSPDGRRLATGSADHFARVWEIASGRELAHLIHNDAVYAMAFSPDGQWIASSSWDKTAQVWEAASGREIVRLTHDDAIYNVAFSPNGRWVATSSGDDTARVWEVASGREVARLVHDDGVNDVAFSPDGRWVATGSADKTARVWEIASGREVAHLLHGDVVNAVSFSPDGQWIASSSWDNTARVWEIASGREVARLKHGYRVSDVAFSPDSRWVATGSVDNTARVWEAASGREVTRVIHGGGVSAVSFSPDGQWIASSSWDNTARVWEIASGREVARLVHDDGVNDVAFSPDGRWVTTSSSDKTARVWEIASGREVARLAHNDTVNNVTFSPDGRWVATGSADKTARVWEIASGREVARLTHDDAVYDVAFSPDGRWVATGSRDYTARLWEAASGREMKRLRHGSVVNAVAFSLDGQWVATGSWDNTARLWEVVSGREVARFTHDDYVFAVAFSSDGQWVATGSADKTARVWWLSSAQDLIQHACTRLPRNLTQSEWQQYLPGEPYRKTCELLPEGD